MDRLTWMRVVRLGSGRHVPRIAVPRLVVGGRVALWHCGAGRSRDVFDRAISRAVIKKPMPIGGEGRDIWVLSSLTGIPGSLPVRPLLPNVAGNSQDSSLSRDIHHVVRPSSMPEPCRFARTPRPSAFLSRRPDTRRGKARHGRHCGAPNSTRKARWLFAFDFRSYPKGHV
jgi:hypothetical protein